MHGFALGWDLSIFTSSHATKDQYTHNIKIKLHCSVWDSWVSWGK